MNPGTLIKIHPFWGEDPPEWRIYLGDDRWITSRGPRREPLTIFYEWLNRENDYARQGVPHCRYEFFE